MTGATARSSAFEQKGTMMSDKKAMNEKPRTDVALRKEPGAVVILQQDPAELRELLSQTLGGGAIELQDLDRIKTPTGGVLTFSVPTPAGDKPQPTLTGIVVSTRIRRAYWAEPGAGSPPDCASPDGIRGEGDPGGACALCPLSKFPEDGGAPPCRRTMDVVFFGDADRLPTILALAPTGVQAAERYKLALVKRGLRLSDVVTVIGLERATARGGIIYAKPVFTMRSLLEPAQRVRMREIVAALGFGVPAAPTASAAPAAAPAAPDDDIPEHATLDLTADDDVPPPVPPPDDDIPF
jgi:hypothetical protein